MNFTLSHSAQKDLKKIWNYTLDNWGEKAAVLHEKMDMISTLQNRLSI